MMDINDHMSYLRNVVRLTGLKISDHELHNFKIYHEKILEWNKRTNLVSKNDEINIVKRHFCESVAMLGVVEIPMNANVIDVGSGAGFPGIPIKIVRPDLNLVLLDSKRIKALFLNDVVNRLELNKILVVNKRCEDLIEFVDFQVKFDFVFARAVTDLSVLYKWTRSLLREGGSLLALKGGDLREELQNLKQEFDVNNVELLNLMNLANGRKVVVVKVDF